MSSFPLRLAPADAFARLRDFLREVSFDTATVRDKWVIPDLGTLGAVRWEIIRGEASTPELGLCVDFFARGLRVRRDELRAAVGGAVWEALDELGLLRASKVAPDDVSCPAWVYPVDGFILASDRCNDADGGPLALEDDAVMPAIYPGTLDFLRMMPDAAGGEALDLCGGCGIGALHLSRTAGRVATSDLTARAARFAEFNARLNGIEVESLQGDLFSTVAGRSFDLITAHPPFVPALGRTLVYRDGGEAGEDVTRAIIKGLPQFLRPGGTCMLACLARDTTDEALEHRVRDWLGEARDEFDVVFGLESTLSVDQAIESMHRRSDRISADQWHALAERLRKLKTRQFVFGVLLIERGPGAGRLGPLRVEFDDSASAADGEKLMAWRRRRRGPGFADRLARSRPRLSPRLEMHGRYVVRDGGLVPHEFVFFSRGPCTAHVALDGWMVPLIARLVGRETVAEIHRAAEAAGELKPGFPLDAFVELVARAVEVDFLEVDLPDG